jgi:hypothetical protein
VKSFACGAAALFTKSKQTFVTFTSALLIFFLLSGCSGSGENEGLKLFPSDQLPKEVQAASQAVKEAYQFAAANPDIMQHIPCYCGCGEMGHTSNYSCYISSVDDAGKIAFDNHALGCSICVDITQDTMRMTAEGSSVDEIKAFVDATYSKYGVTNMP